MARIKGLGHWIRVKDEVFDGVLDWAENTRGGNTGENDDFDRWALLSHLIPHGDFCNSFDAFGFCAK